MNVFIVIQLIITLRTERASDGYFVKLPVVLNERVQVISVYILAGVFAGPVDVLRHVSASPKGLVIYVIYLILSSCKAAVHALEIQTDLQVNTGS